MTEGVVADGSAGALADSVNTAPPCCLGALAVGLDSTVVTGKGCDLGKTAFREVVTVQRLLNQVATTDLSTLSYSVVEMMCKIFINYRKS